MVVSLINKILLLMFFISILNCLRHVWWVINNLREETPVRYILSLRERVLLGVSFSYIITLILTGFKV